MNGNISIRNPNESRLRSRLGMLLLAHFALVCVVKLSRGSHEDLWWLSHLALFISGAGLLFGSALLVATALTSVLILHGVWLYDFSTWLMHGESALGITSYVEDADFWTWIATAHHFYLAPLLLFIFARDRRYPRETLPLTAALFLYLTLISRGVLSSAANVNYSFGILPAWDVPLVNWFNSLPGVAYLIGLNLLACGCFFLPTALFCRRVATSREEFC